MRFSEWISLAQSKGWEVLLDAAAFVPTNGLDLSRWRPDFVDLSFYKMFGLPTGVGALLVRKDKLPLLRRPAFFGGTVEYVGVGFQTHILKKGHGGFEDGTLDYLSIPAVEIGLRFLKQVPGALPFQRWVGGFNCSVAFHGTSFTHIPAVCIKNAYAAFLYVLDPLSLTCWRLVRSTSEQCYHSVFE